MRGKAHNPSGRILRGRTACLILVICIPICTLLGVGNAYAGARLTGAIGSLTTAGVSAATAAAPVGEAATLALGAPPDPATSATTPAPGAAVTPLAKAPIPSAAGADGGGPTLAKATTQGAAATITPLGKALAPSAGHVLAPVSNAPTRALAPTVQRVGGLASATSGLIHQETSSSEASANALATVVKGAVATAAGISTLPSTVGENLISAPQGAPAALRGAIGAIDGALWVAVSSAPASRPLELLGSLLPRLALSPPAGISAAGAPAQGLPAAVMAAVARAPAGINAGPDGPATPVLAPVAVAGAGASACAPSGLQGLLGERCGAGHPPRPSRLPGRSPGSVLAAAGSALLTSMVGAGSDRTDTRAGPGSRGIPGAVPIPAPSGASGSAAASGFAVSIFLTLAGLVLLAAPRAMRRLRLPREPWLQARFVLIPERPG